MKLFFVILCLFFSTVLFLELVVKAQAETSDAVINEVMWAGDEYVELYNNSDDEINLNGFSIARQKADQSEPENIVTFSEEDHIAGKGFFLLQTAGATFEEADKAWPANKLVNSGYLLFLLNAAGEKIDTVNAQGAWFAGANTDGGISMERVDVNVSGEDKGNWQSAIQEFSNRKGTPRQQNTKAIEEVSPSPPAASPSPTSQMPTPTVSVTPQPGIYSSAIIINEFLPNPVGSDTNTEFIELFNSGDAEEDLSGWVLDDSEGGSSPFMIPANTKILPASFIVFYQNATKITLNNDTDAVRLVSPDGALKSSFMYAGNPPEGQSYNYDDEGQYRLSTTLTPGEMNVVTQPKEDDTTEDAENEAERKEYTNAVKINEFLPNAVGSDTTNEFIELINTGSDTVDLTGWKVDDGEGGSAPYTLPEGTSISAKGIISFSSSITKISLGNSGDSVRLLDPNGDSKDSFAYSQVMAEGVSFNRKSDGVFVLSNAPTPGKENVITEDGSAGVGSEDSPLVVTLQDIRSYPLGSVVTTEGVVSVPPKTLGDTIIYLAGSGVQVYLASGFPESIKEGDMLRVTGELSSSFGEMRIKVATKEDLQVVKTGEPPIPHTVSTGDINEALEGFLVSIEGVVTQTSGATFYIDDGSGEARVFIRSTTGIVKPKMKKDMKVRIVGVVSRTSSGYRVLPRYQSDVVVIAAAPTAQKAKAASKTPAAKTASAVRSAATKMSSSQKTIREENSNVETYYPAPGVQSGIVFGGSITAIALLLLAMQAKEPLLALT